MKYIEYVLCAVVGVLLGLLGGLLYAERYMVVERPNEAVCAELRWLRDAPQKQCEDYKYDCGTEPCVNIKVKPLTINLNSPGLEWSE